MKANSYLVLALASIAAAMDSMDSMHPMAESMMPMPTQSQASPMPPTSSSLLIPADMASSYANMGSGSAVATETAMSMFSESAAATTTSMAMDNSETEVSSSGMDNLSSMPIVSTESMGHHMGTGGMMPNATGTATAPGQQAPVSAGISVHAGSFGFCFAAAVLGAVLAM